MQNQNQKSLFRIHVRPDRQATKAQKGRINNIDGIQETNEMTDVLIEPPLQTIPNYYSHPVIKEMDKKDNYNGKFTFCKSSDTGKVENIEIRYLPNCPSLDKQWQIKNGYAPKTAREHVGWEYDANKIQEFDEATTDPLFIEMFKHHQGNGSNPNRDRNNGIMFVEVDAGKNIDQWGEMIDKEEAKFKFLKMVKTDDDFVQIYSDLSGIAGHYEIVIRRDELIKHIQQFGVDKYLAQIEKWKAGFTALMRAWLVNKDVSFKEGKLYESKNPEPRFQTTELEKGSVEQMTEELIGQVMTRYEVYKEFEGIQQQLI